MRWCESDTATICYIWCYFVRVCQHSEETAEAAAEVAQVK